jgi:hypothetical protein
MTFSGLRPAPGSSIEMLGVKAALKWHADATGASVEVPPSVIHAPPCRHAFTLRMTLADA